VVPPFTVAVNYLSRGHYLVEPLRSLMSPDYLIAFILIRLGSYAIGLCEGEGLVTSKVGTGLVHSRHRQGGSSAARFRRHREKQIEYFMTRVGGHIREYLEPYAARTDYIVYGGAQTTIATLLKQCPFLGRLKGELLPPLLDIADPRQVVLEKAVRQVWSSAVTEWRREPEVF
jgi:peptide subunit release factor 1 (eRF1)